MWGWFKDKLKCLRSCKSYKSSSIVEITSSYIGISIVINIKTSNLTNVLKLLKIALKPSSLILTFANFKNNLYKFINLEIYWPISIPA